MPMDEVQIRETIADCFRKGKKGFPKCEYVVYSKSRKASDEVSNKFKAL